MVAAALPHADNYNAKEARNENRNFIVNRGLPAQGGAAGVTPSYGRIPMNSNANSMQAQPRQPQYGQPQQYQQPRQPQYGQQPYQGQQYQQPRQPQYGQQQYQGQPQQYQQPQYGQQPYQGQPQQYQQPYQQPARPAQPARNTEKEAPTFLQRMFKKK